VRAVAAAAERIVPQQVQRQPRNAPRPLGWDQDAKKNAAFLMSVVVRLYSRKKWYTQPSSNTMHAKCDWIRNGTSPIRSDEYGEKIACGGTMQTRNASEQKGRMRRERVSKKRTGARFRRREDRRALLPGRGHHLGPGWHAVWRLEIVLFLFVFFFSPFLPRDFFFF
jgi:hypothetical protein